jgi:two-component system, OmpR family, phosphate regulon sensor histidine kinase PhoR
MKNRRFFWQIFPAVLLIVITSILASNWYGSSMIRSFYYQEIEEDIQARALLLGPHTLHLLQNHPAQLQDFCRESGRSAKTRITVIAANGSVLADSNENPQQMDNHKSRPEIETAMNGQVGVSLRHSKTLDQNMLYVAIPLQKNKPLITVLRLSVPATSLDTVLSAIGTKLLFGTFLIALVAALLSYYLSRRIAIPLEEMRLGAEHLASGKTDKPILLSGSNTSKEISDLSQSLNNMAEQINGRINTIIQQRNELEAVFSSMTDGVLAIAADHKIIRINRAAADFFQIDSQAVQSVPFEGVIRNQQLQQFLNGALIEKNSLQQELNLTENGAQVHLLCKTHPLYDGENERLGSLVVMNNLTRINQLENIRQDFVANVSHELKTPITAIQGYVETLLDGTMTEDPQEANRFLKIIHRQVVRLDAIVDDLLTLARIEDNTERNEMSLNPEQICPILEAALQTCTVKADQKQIQIDIECDHDLMAQVNRPMLEQAIINLLTNGVSYSLEKSHIHILAKEVRDENSQKKLVISIKDEGPGIEAKHLKRIFERFYRCDKARSRKHGGTGLGLAIVKHIAESHNGMVEVSSQIGQGSTFRLILPFGTE